MSKVACIAAFLLFAAAPVSHAQTLTTLHSFCTTTVLTAAGDVCPDGYLPGRSVIQAWNGDFYGVVGTGGTHVSGVLYRIGPGGKLTVMHDFCSVLGCTDGGSPVTPLTQAGDGNLYGVTWEGGANDSQGVVFRTSLAGAEVPIYGICPMGTDLIDCPYEVAAPLIEGSDGNFYGTSELGSSHWSYAGTAFMLTPGGSENAIYNFCAIGTSTEACNDGNESEAPLVEGSDGNFYGTTLGTGEDGPGTVFQLTPEGVLTTLYTFCSQTSCSDGEFPNDSALVEGPDGNFYGGTEPIDNNEGYSNGGTIFTITPGGTFTTVYSFCLHVGCLDGSGVSQLVVGSDGSFYGTTSTGGKYNAGTIFKLTLGGKLTTLYSFCSDVCYDGGMPAGMVQGSDGSFYGVTTAGGLGASWNWENIIGSGTVFKFTPSIALAPPIQVSFSLPKAEPGSPVTLHWKTLNAFSRTMQQCYAFLQSGGQFAGVWTGRQTGVLGGGVYSGSATLTPTADGIYTYALTCGGVESGFGTLTVTGKPPVADLSTTSLTFGDEKVGKTSSAKELILSNRGVSPLVFVDINAGGQFSETNTCGMSLPPNASCTIHVAFTPDWTGKRAGSLAIIDNSGGETPSTQRVALIGTGEGANQTITWPTITGTHYAGSKLALKATASSGLTVSFASETTVVCSVSKAEVTLIKAGTCSIRANQAGNATYNAAPTVSHSFAVAPK